MTAVKQAKVAKTHAGGETRVYQRGGRQQDKQADMKVT